MIHGGKQSGHETVAGADRIGDLDVRSGDFNSLAVEHREGRPVTERRDEKRGPVAAHAARLSSTGRSG